MPARRAPRRAPSTLPRPEPPASPLAEWLALLNYKWLLLAGHYVLDPWERVVVNIIILTCVALAVHMLATSSLLASAVGAAASAVRSRF
ncbi:hypothetical protein H4R19_004037 [Coemansia spiralis]|nr:hypothetical protein H4R19_004037 [Coemansia spiralis]